jgi:hypothetical protein
MVSVVVASVTLLLGWPSITERDGEAEPWDMQAGGETVWKA